MQHLIRELTEERVQQVKQHVIQFVRSLTEERVQHSQELQALRLEYMKGLEDMRLKQLEEAKQARLKSIEEYCTVMANQIELMKMLHDILLQERRRKAGTSRVRPLWNPKSGELWYDGCLIKKFGKPAPHQRKLLDWFRSNRFKTPIANPWLSVTNSNTAIQTCINTVDGLNDDHQTPGLLRFGHQDIGGKVYWQALRNESAK